MTTIFSHIAESFLQVEINCYIKSSISKDTKYGPVRDTELSTIKRQEAVKLLSKLERNNYPGNDQKALEDLKNLIDKYKEKVKQIIIEENEKKGIYGEPDEGTFGHMMDECILLVGEVYKKFKELNLLNIERNKDPMSIMDYWLSYYFIQKLYDHRHKSNWSGIGNMFTGSNNKRLTAEKETAALAALEKCLRAVDSIDKGLSESKYKEIRKERVIDILETLQQTNQNLCKKYGVSFPIPVVNIAIASLSVSTPTLRPDVGFLEKCIFAAKKEIEEGCNKEYEVISQVAANHDKSVGASSSLRKQGSQLSEKKVMRKIATSALKNRQRIVNKEKEPEIAEPLYDEVINMLPPADTDETVSTELSNKDEAPVAPASPSTRAERKKETSLTESRNNQSKAARRKIRARVERSLPSPSEKKEPAEDNGEVQQSEEPNSFALV